MPLAPVVPLAEVGPLGPLAPLAPVAPVEPVAPNAAAVATGDADAVCAAAPEDPADEEEPDGLASTEARFACADFSAACASSRVTWAVVGSISASSWPALTCSPVWT